jgi:glycosyltransferase involved in cell wall biosynthesis
MSQPAPLTLSIVTPSYKQPAWLRLCAASIADQAAPGLVIEHIVQDSLSGPEVEEALKPFPNVKFFSEKDQGMYDAVRRGWARATGDILCWLNCDEQYLPGALREVAHYFRDHPEVDLLFGDAIVVDGAGGYLCSRQVMVPQLYHTWTCQLHTLSCATFFRRDLLTTRGFALDPRWRDAGDGALIVQMLRAGVRGGVLRRYLSTFGDNGENRGLRPLAIQERAELRSQAPRWIQALRPLWVLLHRLRRLCHGLYHPKPFAYDIFTETSPRQRVHFEVTHPTFYWKARMR